MPANLDLILEAINNAVTLEPVKGRAYEWSKHTFKTTYETQNEELISVGIKNTNLFWSFGLYAFIFILLFIALVLYYLLKYIVTKYPILKKVERYYRKKLFYSSAIRYMIQSNLKITHNSVFFLAIMGSFDTLEEQVSTIVIAIFLGLIILWPAFLTGFLLYYRDRLEKKEFKKRFFSMYDRIKTDNYLGGEFPTNKNKCLLYNAVFCLRRLSLVMTYYFCRDMHSDAGLYGILALQTCYILYIV